MHNCKILSIFFFEELYCHVNNNKTAGSLTTVKKNTIYYKRLYKFNFYSVLLDHHDV